MVRARQSVWGVLAPRARLPPVSGASAASDGRSCRLRALPRLRTQHRRLDTLRMFLLCLVITNSVFAFVCFDTVVRCVVFCHFSL